MASGQQAVDILFFWWQAGPERWFSTDAAFDRRIADRFMATYHHAASGGLDHWEATPHGALALLILLDQLPRNLFRETPPRAFATDNKALAVSKRALARRDHLAYPAPARQYRNRILGRKNTAAEEAFLQEGGLLT